MWEWLEILFQNGIRSHACWSLVKTVTSIILFKCANYWHNCNKHIANTLNYCITGSTTPMCALKLPATHIIVWQSLRPANLSTSSLKTSFSAYVLPVWGSWTQMTHTICWRIIIHTAMILPCHLSTRTTSLLISSFTMIPTPLLLPSPPACSILYPSAIFRALSPFHFVSCTHSTSIFRLFIISTTSNAFPSIVPTLSRTSHKGRCRLDALPGPWRQRQEMYEDSSYISRRCREVRRVGCPGRGIPISIQSCSHHNNFGHRSRCSAALADLQRGLTSQFPSPRCFVWPGFNI